MAMNTQGEKHAYDWFCLATYWKTIEKLDLRLPRRWPNKNESFKGEKATLWRMWAFFLFMSNENRHDDKKKVRGDKTWTFSKVKPGKSVAFLLILFCLQHNRLYSLRETKPQSLRIHTRLFRRCLNLGRSTSSRWLWVVLHIIFFFVDGYACVCR